MAIRFNFLGRKADVSRARQCDLIYFAAKMNRVTL